MSQKTINTDQEKEDLLRTWDYLNANGKVFILTETFGEGESESAVIYTEEDKAGGKKTIRAFMEGQAVELYAIYAAKNNKAGGSQFNIGITPVKHLQKQLSSVYGKEMDGTKVVECILTSYDDSGKMHNVDTIWTQNNN